MNFYTFTDREIVGGIRAEYLHSVIAEYLKCQFISFNDLIVVCESDSDAMFRKVSNYFLCLVTYLYNREVYTLRKACKGVFSIIYDAKHKLFLLQNEDSEAKFKITKNYIDAFNLFLLKNNTDAIDQIVTEQHISDTKLKINAEKKKIEKYQRLMENTQTRLTNLEKEYETLTGSIQ